MLVATADDPVFDADRYLATNTDVREAGMDALEHYLRWGWSEGRSPAPALDERLYRREAGLGPRDRVSGLGHYLAVGRSRGLGPRRDGAAEPAARSEMDADEALAGLMRLPPPSASGPEPLVDVIVPVYRGRAETLRCLLSVLRAENATPFRLVVIDDRGPDLRLRADIARLARRGLFELVVQPANRGFVAAINRGMALDPARDVIWLNADTEVWGDWIDRLRRAAYAAPDIATVTPLTNNGTICSYPRFNADNPHPPECGWAALDRLAATANAGRSIDIPTCVGFCTYVRRDAIARVGPLDEAAFGAGYGEENDFSCRAVAAGLRNVAAGDVFVRHLGQTSFGDARSARVENAMRVMEARHPGYTRTVARFIAADPMAPLRASLDHARLEAHLSGARSGRRVLLVTHSLGGGTERHVREEIARLEREGARAVVMRGAAGGSARLDHPQLGPMPTLETLPLTPASFATLCERLRVTEIHIHHLADFGADAAARFRALLDAAGRRCEVVVHDYLPICPRINLADASGLWCGEPGERGCRRCLLTRRSPFGAPDIRRWRRDYGALLAMASRVRVPDVSVADRLRRHFPSLGNVVVRPHEELVPRAGPRPARAPGEGLRIAVIGAIGPIKGFDVLIGLADEIRRRRAGCTIHVLGYTRDDRAARAAGLEVTGPYREDEVAERITGIDPHLIFIPSTWPETYCYTLSHALLSGRPVAGFAVGAVETRLGEARRLGYPATLLPLSLARDSTALLAALVTAADQAPEAPAPVARSADDCRAGVSRSSGQAALAVSE